MRYFCTVGCALSLSLAVCSPANADLPKSSSPSVWVERGASTLLWLSTHTRPGTKHSRAIVARDARWLIVTGLKRAGVYNCFTGGIHQHEAAWNDYGDPYWGGLQMDRGFQSTYGGRFLRWGLANNWPPWAQLVVAYRAYRGYAGYGPRYFGPWPTRRFC